MKACAARGGVIGINGFGPFLGANDASTETYIAHVEYALDLVGEDHVGIALDYVFDRAELDEYIAADPVTFPPQLYSHGAQIVEPWRLPQLDSGLPVVAILRRRSANSSAKTGSVSPAKVWRYRRCRTLPRALEMKVLIIGAGLIGITTAHQPARCRRTTLKNPHLNVAETCRLPTLNPDNFPALSLRVIVLTWRRSPT
jgi:Membrane dipeptidase (Peptidase family M19)